MKDSTLGNAPHAFDDSLDVLADLLEAAGIDAVDAASIQQRKASAPVPMSFAQELLWLLDRATPGMTAYNVPIARRLRGALNVAALERALGTVVARHESLRTRLAEVDGEARQLIDDPSAVALRFIDLTAVAPTSREAEAQRVVRERALAPFDMAHEHLFRPTLVRLAPDDHVLLLESHHIVMDGWSLGILFRELSAAYAAARVGRDASLPPLRIQFADYAIWQRHRLAGDRLAELLSFWRKQLGDATTPLALPTDFPRAAVPTYAGSRETLVLDAAELNKVKRLASAHGATVYMMLIAAYAAVLHRYTGRDDVLIGSGSAGRTHPETEALVGYLNNTLVQHADCSGDPTFGELLDRVRDSALNAYDHQEISLEHLVLELRQGQDRLAPLFEVVLTMQDANQSGVTLEDVAVEPFGIELGGTKFDITLLVTERPHGLVLTAQYRSDLFRPDTMRRFLGHVRNVLGADPATHLSRIPLLSADENTQLASWNATTTDTGAPASLVELFERQAARVGERSAVVGPDVLTYAELNARSNQLAHRLRELGVASNAPVGLLLDRSSSAIVALLGILKAGGAYVPLSVDAPAPRIEQQLKECGAKVVVTMTAHASLAPTGVTVIALDRAEDAARLDTMQKTNPAPVATPDTLAYVLYTSGSTGVPKGVAITHANAVHYARAVSRVLADTPAAAAGDGFAALDGLSFAMASTLAADLGNTSLLPSLLAGGTLHLLAKDVTTDPARYAEYVTANHVDVLKITPNHLAALTAGKSGSDLASRLPKRWLVLGGEALQPDVARALLAAGSCRVLNHYGPTETTVGACATEVTREWLDAVLALGAQTVPLGRPLANMHAYVVDANNNEQPVGIPGELLLSGAGVAQGYLGRADLTVERFIHFGAERAYRTGDRVRRLSDGTIEFLGRADDQVKVRGYRVELGEIEQLMTKHAGVRQAVVTLHAPAGEEPMLVGYVVPRSGYELAHAERPTNEAIREWVGTQLPEYMVPSVILTLDALPLTSNGKVDRAKLPAPDASAGTVSYVAPRTDTETKLAAIWEEVLKKERVGVSENFLTLGGHSLLAIRVLGKISRAFGVRLPLRTLFEAPTVEQLAVALEAERKVAAPTPSIVPRSRGTS